MIEYLWQMPLIYFVLYIAFVVAKSSGMIKIGGVDIFDKIIFCPVCATWFSYMVYGFFVYPIIISSLQIGLSMTGLSMYFNEELGKKQKRFPFDFFTLQIGFTIIGLILVILKVKYFILS